MHGPFPSHGLFLTCTQEIVCFYVKHTFIICITLYKHTWIYCVGKRKRLLTWNGGFLYMVANFFESSSMVVSSSCSFLFLNASLFNILPTSRGLGHSSTGSLFESYPPVAWPDQGTPSVLGFCNTTCPPACTFWGATLLQWTWDPVEVNM